MDLAAQVKDKSGESGANRRTQSRPAASRSKSSNGPVSKSSTSRSSNSNRSPNRLPSTNSSKSSSRKPSGSKQSPQSVSRAQTYDALRQRANSARSMADLMRSQSQSRGLPGRNPVSPGAFIGRGSSSRSAGETRAGVPSPRSSGLESRSSDTNADRAARSQALESLRQRAKSARSIADLMKTQSQSRGTAGKGDPRRSPTTISYRISISTLLRRR